MAFSLLSYSFILFHRKKLRREKGENTASELTKFYNASLKRATLQFGEFEFSLSCAYFFLFFLLSFLFFLFTSTLLTNLENGLHVRSIFEKLVKLNKGYKVKESIYTRIIQLNYAKFK